MRIVWRPLAVLVLSLALPLV
ncbi:MAG: hypothetical protein H6R20_1647, partial [Proteobacteria bacterium]|nr:hypothetical protein [Pseudomonadota bacterium]